jgi:hypothetical protein
MSEHFFDEGKIFEYLKTHGYDTESIFVYAIVSDSIAKRLLLRGAIGMFAQPLIKKDQFYIISISNIGIVLLGIEGNSFTGDNHFIKGIDIEDISFEEGFLKSTLYVREINSKEMKFNISNTILGVRDGSWQKRNVALLPNFISDILEKGFIPLEEKMPPEVEDIGESENNANKKRTVIEEDKTIISREIWICGRCGTENKFELDNCKNCGKEYNPPL